MSNKPPKLPIKGGYYLKARAINDNKLALAPPHVREIWDYFLRKAFWKDGEQLNRGQLLTRYKDIQHDLRWMVGARTMMYKKHQVETALKLLSVANRVTTTRTTRGIIVTILNYDVYQTQESYDNYNETYSRPIREPHESPTIDETSKQTGETFKRSTPTLGVKSDELFERFQQVHINCTKVARQAYDAMIMNCANVNGLPNIEEAIEVFDREMSGSALPVPLREFKKYLRHSCGKENEGGVNFQKKTAPSFIPAPLPAGHESKLERMAREARERSAAIDVVEPSQETRGIEAVLDFD